MTISVAARQQLIRAVRTFERFGIQVHGFRCPYLGSSTDLLDSVPEGVFQYSGNGPICWDLANLTSHTSRYFEILYRFYQGKPATSTVCVPSICFNVIEIPVCVPDDLQLHDGANLGGEEIAQAWIQILDQTYRRGALFTLIFHPELASYLQQSFVALLSKARRCTPPIWIARLCDISFWWREKANFRAKVTYTSGGIHVSFSCLDRATILAKGVQLAASRSTWDGPYYRLHAKEIDVPTGLRPFVGLAHDVPASIEFFLQGQGYILDTSDTAMCCTVFIDGGTLSRLANKVELVDHIEASASQLIRYWRWPDGAKSTLSVTGDLDALTLLDYASRLFVR